MTAAPEVVAAEVSGAARGGWAGGRASGAGTDTRAQLPFPLRSPGDHAGNKRKILAMLGGEKILNRSVFNERAGAQPSQPADEDEDAGEGNRLRLWLHPGATMPHGLAVSSSGPPVLVLRVRRRRRDGQLVHASVIGATDSMQRFDLPCDMIYRPSPGNPTESQEPRIVASLAEKLPRALQPLEQRAVEDSEAARRDLWLPPQFCVPRPGPLFQFGESARDKDEPSLQSFPKKDDCARPELLEKIRGLFAERPCWLREVLQQHLDASWAQIAQCLGQVAQQVRAGPFGGVLVRLDYDPRMDRGSSKFQVLIYKIPKDRRRVLERHSGAKLFGMPLRYRNRAQMCDVRDRVVRELSQTSVRAVYDSRHGWFNSDARELMRKRLRDEALKVVALLQAGHKAEDIPAELSEANVPPLGELDEWRMGPPPPTPPSQPASPAAAKPRSRSRPAAPTGSGKAGTAAAGPADKLDTVAAYDVFGGDGGGGDDDDDDDDASSGGSMDEDEEDEEEEGEEEESAAL